MQKINRKNRQQILKLVLIALFLILASATHASTIDTIDLPGMTINMKEGSNPKEVTGTLEMILVITIIALAPSILIMMTSFLRIIISLHFIRAAVGTQTVPPNQILIGIALFLTFFIMSPVINDINKTAIEPYEQSKITQEQALQKGVLPLKDFMLRQTRDEDIALFTSIAGKEVDIDETKILEEMPLHIIVPAFIISELRAGFLIGFMLYIPFIVIDMIVSATLMSMGMMMLPPAMISTPFKILLFILCDGWNLLIGQIIGTFS